MSKAEEPIRYVVFSEGETFEVECQPEELEAEVDRVNNNLRRLSGNQEEKTE